MKKPTEVVGFLLTKGGKAEVRLALCEGLAARHGARVKPDPGGIEVL